MVVVFHLLSSRSCARYESGDHVAVYPANDSSLVNQIGEILGTDLDTIMSLNNLDGEYGSPLSSSSSLAAMASVLPTRAGADRLRVPQGTSRQAEESPLAASRLKWVGCETCLLCPFNSKLCNGTLLITERRPAGASLCRSSPGAQWGLRV